MNNAKDFKLYPAESNTQITNREELIRGRKVFSKVIEPQKTDLESIPAVVFSFFDPRAGQYRTITKEPIPIVVETGEQEIPIQLTLSGSNIASAKQQAQILTQDILPIMTNLSSLQNQGEYIYKNSFIIGCLSIPAIAVIVSFFITRHKEKLQTDIGYARDKRAHAIAKRGWRWQNLRFLRTPQKNFMHLFPSQWQITWRINLIFLLANATSDKVGILLKHRGVDDNIIEEVSRCLTDFDYRRFSKDGGTKEEMDHSLKLAEQLIAKLERQL